MVISQLFRPSAGQPSAAIYYYIQFQQMAGCIGCIYNKHNNRKSAFTEERTTAVKLCNNFESKLFYELCLIAGINKSHTTAFHPQSDGQTERMNRTLLQMLKTTADDNPATWPQRLPIVMAAYRMTVHKTTGMTPNMAMLGREVMLPAALIARPLRSLTALLCLSFTTSGMPCEMPISVCETLLSRRHEHRKCITMIGRGKLSSSKASLCGYCGQDHRSARSSENFSDYGQEDRGVSNFSSRRC